jgi:hypothetical protein
MPSPPRRHRSPRRVALAAGLAALFPLAARAASPESVPVSPEAALTANAVLASDDPGGGGWYNPAALGGVTRSSIQVGASAYSESGTLIKDAAQVSLPWGTATGDIRSWRYSSVPSVLSYSFRLRDGLGLSLGVWTPYHDYDGGSTTITSSGTFPGTPNLNTAYAATYAFTERRDDTWAGVAMGWQATRRLRIGGMLQGAYSTDVWTIDVNTTLKPDDPAQSGSHLVYSERGDVGVIGLRTLFGLQWDATDALRIAAAVRGPTIRLAAWGPTNKFLSFGIVMPAVSPPQQGLVGQETKPPRGISAVEPVRLSGGLRYAGTGWSLAGEGDWHPALNGQFGDFKEGWNARLGGTYRLGPDLVVGAGFFKESASAEAAASRSSLTYWGFTGGATYRPSAVVKVLQGGNAWDLLTSIAVRGAYGSGHYRGIFIAPVDPTVNFPDASTTVIEGSIAFFTTIMF